MRIMYTLNVGLPPNATVDDRLNPDTGKLGMSYSKFKRKDLSKLGHLILKVKLLHLCMLFLLIP